MKVKKAICQPLSLKTHLAGGIVSGSATVTGGDAGGVPVAGDAPASLVRDRGGGSHCQKAGGDKQQLHDGDVVEEEVLILCSWGFCASAADFYT